MPKRRAGSSPVLGTSNQAEMAELADALRSGRSPGNRVQVQLLFSAQIGTLDSYTRSGTIASDRAKRGHLAQLVERYIYTVDVRGSSPLVPTIA